ncbi:MAG: beta-lactamase family protein [Clostridia bacterium]|nr:beta-lactamase family protein [Clostridia bacterium]
MTYDIPDELLAEAGRKTNGLYNTLDVVKLMSKMPLSFEPGTYWQYSFCHDVLAAVIEVIAGKKCRDYVKENIFDPLGMQESYFHAQGDVAKRMAPLYDFVADEAIVDNKRQDGGYTQSVDMSKFGGHLERRPI